MERLSKDELFLIAIELNITELLNLCLSSKNIKNKICDRNDFWVHKLKKDFDINFFENVKLPKSNRLRENFIKTLPAKKEYLKYNKLINSFPNLNDALLEGVNTDNFKLIEIALFRGAEINNKDDSFKIVKYFINLNERDDYLTSKDEQIKHVIILYDKVLPLISKHIDSKNFWKMVLLKLNEFKGQNKVFEEIYNRKKELYEKLAK